MNDKTYWTGTLDAIWDEEERTELDLDDDFVSGVESLAEARKDAAVEFLRLAALAGAKANTFLIQKQVDAEYASILTQLEAQLDYLKTALLARANGRN